MATESKVPTGDSGAESDWTPLGGGSRFSECDDAVGAPDGDTSYISATATNDQQRFTFAAFAITSSAVAKVTITYRALRVGGAGAGSARSVCMVASTTGVGSTPSFTGSYADYVQDYLTNPGSGAAWTEAEVEGVGTHGLQEFGVQARGMSAATLRCTQCYVTVDYTAGGGGSAFPHHYYSQMRVM